MKILLFGAQGQVGLALQQRLKDGHELVALGRAQVDLTDPIQIIDAININSPDLIINAAAYTAVDLAEEDQQTCFAVNAIAPKVMAEHAASNNVALIHYSTDYVYDGTSSLPYKETDKTNPMGVYGQSKLEGDLAVIDSGAGALIFRTSWVYGETGKNFYLTMRRLLQERDELKVVDDQIGTPTLATAIADATVEIINQGQNDIRGFISQHSGLYNMTCGGETSWYGFACAIADELKKSTSKTAKLIPIPTSDYPTPAKRPAYTVLDNSKLLKTFSVKLPDWLLGLTQGSWALGSDPDK